MNTATKLGGFTLGLLAAFGAAAGIGNAVGPIGPAGDDAPHDGGAHTSPSTGATADSAAAEELPGGLMISQHGYTLDLDGAGLPAGPATPVAFRILGPDGQALTDYDTSHDEDLHLIAVRRDLTGFQHVHPELGPDGTWRTPLELTPGAWRLFADFDPAGADEALTLGADVPVAGQYTPQPLPEPSRTAEVDGYTVTLDGELVPGRESELTLSISRNGEPVTDLQPYLAAYGHLVALRDGDLAYLHVHPDGAPDDGSTEPGPDVVFYAAVPSAGTYHLYLDFKHDGVVRTAAFTVTAGDDSAPTDGSPSPDHGDSSGHEH